MKRTLVALSTLAVAACATNAPSSPPEPLAGLPRALTVAEEQIVERSNRFAFDLMRQSAASRSENRFISPLSVSMALGMLMNGAATGTLDSMRATLGFEGMPMADINAGYRGLIDLLRGLDPTTDMRVANSVWYRHGLQTDADFAAALDASFDASVRGLDFTAPGSVDVINRWAAEATDQRIPTVLQGLDPEAVMYLLNAIYFKAKWVQKFDAAQTQQRPFAAGFGGAQTVPMMGRLLDVRYRFGADARIAELRYGNEAFVMDLVLPPEGGDLSALVDSLTEERWDGWMAALQSGSLAVSLPRFTLKQERVLNDDLTALGMGIAFRDGQADFSQLFDPNAMGPFVSFVKHDTFLQVDEEGTEAAAVTSIGVVVTSMPPSFDVDEPFLLVIRERFSGTILFMGKILRVP